MEQFPQYNNQNSENNEQQENKIEQSHIKEGVDFVFVQHPELAAIGTKEQYSKYLDTVFPETKVKDVVYHGTASKTKIENFNFEKSNFANAVFFTKNRTFAESFAFDDVRHGSVQEQIVDTVNPFDFSNEQHIEELRPIIQDLVTEGYASENTGISFRNDLPQITIGETQIQNPSVEDFVDYYMWRLKNGSWRIIETDRVIDFISKKHDAILINERGAANIAVFNNDQIHILGTPQDIEAFKNHIEACTKSEF